jgi:hypothetical protein
MDIKIPMSEYQRLVQNETVLKVIASMIQSNEYVSKDDLKPILKTANFEKEGE